LAQHSTTLSLILLDEPLLGLEGFLRDFGWNILKVKQGISDDEVLRTSRERNHALVTPDGILAERCRLAGVRVVELSMGEQARLVDKILRQQFK